MSKPFYQVVLFGLIDHRAKGLKTAIQRSLRELGLERTAIRFFDENDVSHLSSGLPTLGVFFGYAGAHLDRHPAIRKLLADSNLIITAVSDLDAVGSEIPEELRHINAIRLSLLDENLPRMASLILESFRLLRKERRLFISYKRTDSEAVANQLYDALDARGFDVFIDTRKVPPAADFQAELWHRLADSDVVVLLDTADFRSSRWTVEELTKANATNIQILHLLWPGQKEDPTSSLSHFKTLSERNFNKGSFTKTGTLTSVAVAAICNQAETLRARAISMRHRYLVDGFCDSARSYGLSPDVQPGRWISVDLPDGKQLAAVPTIGVPTSDRINRVFQDISSSHGGTGGTWLLYDGRGILKTWQEHLGWLDEYLPVRSLTMAKADKAVEAIVR